jgi:5-methylcytosine-specific restriction protein A
MPSLQRRIEERKPDRNQFRAIYQSHRWHEYSRKYLKANRLCVQCLAEGKTTISQCTDHILPMSQGGAIWDPANHQALCLQHHSKKTKEERKI